MEQEDRREPIHKQCPAHSGMDGKMKLIIGLLGSAVVLLLFQVTLTLQMKSDFSESLSGIKERVAVLEYVVLKEAKIGRVGPNESSNHPIHN